MNRFRLPVILLAAAAVSSMGAEAPDSLTLRLNRIREIVGEIGKELDSLEKDIAVRRGRTGPDTGNAEVTASPSQPILGELLTEREKKLAAASGTPFEQGAVGYSFDPNLGIGMHAQYWKGRWGAKAAATGRFSESARQAGLNLSLLRGLHRFSLFEGLQTHLYAFAGAGAFWRRQKFDSFVLQPPVAALSREWYETADMSLRMQIGAGTELGLISLGGIRASPEIGFQAARFIDRYQDSQSWENLSRQFPATLQRPKSDYSLDAYFAFHLSFYFR